jgi:hypothetical protein
MIQLGWPDVVCPHFLTTEGLGKCFTSDNGNYDCYGYDLSKDRWAYEIESPNSERIREAVGCLLQEIGGLTNR